VPDFSGLRPFLLGSSRVATMPGLLAVGLLHGLAHAEVPAECPPMPMFMVWHQRRQADPMHRWLRSELEAVVAPALQDARLAG
jgi:DNA-binding transcriptional LysR family regulator